jgi:3-oxoacyl-[acyl-carrier-protein] synthase II
VSDAVWITGVAAATPLGNTFDLIADNLLAGRCGIRTITGLNDPALSGQLAACMEPIGPPAGLDSVAFGQLRRLQQLVLWCHVEALRDAGWWERRSDRRVGLVLGLGAEWTHVWQMDWLAGGRRVNHPEQDHQSIAQLVREQLGLTGPAVTVAAACASANYALGLARRWVSRGWCDLCLAGGADQVTPLGLAGFANLRALSQRYHDPAGASRPFDLDRDGFVMGEGGAIFVLESAASARRRGARAYAEIAGFGASSDASHMIIPSSDPEPAAQAMRRALADAALGPDDLSYFNAHATSTPVGDRAEVRALKLVLGEATAKVPVSSTKGMTGHLCSGAAAIEAVACLVALARQALPPTINLEHPDPECDLCHVPNQARSHPVRVAASNSFGFGGSNTCLILRQVA